MLRSLWLESFDKLDGSITPEQGSEDAGILTMLGTFFAQEVFTGVDPSTNKSYTTLPAIMTEPQVVLAPIKRPAPTQSEIVMATANKSTPPSKAGVPISKPEQSLQKTETLITALATTIFAPLAMPFDALAINAGLVPLPDEMFGTTFNKFALASKAYEAIPEIIRADPRRMEVITNAVQLAMSTAIPLPGGDVTWSVPTAKENALALEQAQVIARGVIEKMGGMQCPHCLQLPCSCGANEPSLDLASVTGHIEPITTSHNLSLAESSAQNTFIRGTQKRSADTLRKSVQGQEIELLHIPPKSLLIGALLGDWKLLGPAIIASIIPNETGKRGATISIQSKPQNQGGDSLIVNMAELGIGTDTDTFPLNALTSWSQNTLQSALSDRKKLRAKWDKSKHGTTPEIGMLTISNPGNASIRQNIPLAVRFTKGTKTASGGAGVLGMAISELGGIQKFISDVTGTSLAGIPLTQNDDQLAQHATNAAAQKLAEDGMRPGVVAQKTAEILNVIFENTAANPTLQNIANSVMQEQNLKLSAEAKQQRDKAKLQIALSNLQNGLEYGVVLSTKQFIPSEQRDIFVRDEITRKPVPLTQVKQAYTSQQLPSNWKVVNLPTEEVNRGIIDTAIEELKSLSPTPQLWQSILNGDVTLDGIERNTLVKAMLLSTEKDQTPPTPKVKNEKRSFAHRAADAIDLAAALILPTRKFK